MSIDLVKNELLKFIKTPIKLSGPMKEQGQVIALKGQWGSGKTHFWQSLFNENSKACALKDYSYVSLFGLNTLEEIKNQIFINLAPAASGKKQAFVKLASKIGKLAKSIKDVKYFRDGYNLFNALGWETVENSLICLDDLERSGIHQNPKDFLGLISLLKEQKKCNVLLIMDVDKLEPD